MEIPSVFVVFLRLEPPWSRPHANSSRLGVNLGRPHAKGETTWANMGQFVSTWCHIGTNLVTENIKKPLFFIGFSSIFAVSAFMQGWDQSGLTSVQLYLPWGQLALILRSLGLDLVRLDANSHSLGAILAPTWAVLTPSWHQLGLSWGHLGANWPHLSPNLGGSGATWDQLGPT